MPDHLLYSATSGHLLWGSDSGHLLYRIEEQSHDYSQVLTFTPWWDDIIVAGFEIGPTSTIGTQTQKAREYYQEHRRTAAEAELRNAMPSGTWTRFSGSNNYCGTRTEYWRTSAGNWLCRLRERPVCLIVKCPELQQGCNAVKAIHIKARGYAYDYGTQAPYPELSACIPLAAGTVQATDAKLTRYPDLVDLSGIELETRTSGVYLDYTLQVGQIVPANGYIAVYIWYDQFGLPQGANSGDYVYQCYLLNYDLTVDFTRINLPGGQ